MVKKIFLFIVSAIIAAACLDEPDCYQLNNQIVGIGFKKLTDGTADTVSIIGLGTLDPPILFSEDTLDLSRIFLDLNYFKNETTYFFRDFETFDTLKLGYVSQAQYVSESCGEKFVLSHLKVLDHTFDSVRLVTDVPTGNGSSIQIEIFQ